MAQKYFSPQRICTVGCVPRDQSMSSISTFNLCSKSVNAANITSSSAVFERARIGDTVPESRSNVALSVDSNNGTQGLVLPSFTTVQASGMTNVPQGFLLYNSTTKALWFRNSTAWEACAGSLVVADEADDADAADAQSGADATDAQSDADAADAQSGADAADAADAQPGADAAPATVADAAAAAIG